MTDRKHRTLLHSPNEVPEFADEEEEARFWEEHDIGEEFWKQLPDEPADDLLPPKRGPETNVHPGNTARRVPR